jgi:hypothetical protein
MGLGPDLPDSTSQRCAGGGVVHANSDDGAAGLRYRRPMVPELFFI